jgi:hypothetical protein
MGGLFDRIDRRLEERKELFEPPAEVSPAEFSARLEEDEELLNEIRERFEQGRTSGRFPALSEFLSHLSVKEPEKFFKTGGRQAYYPVESPEDSRVRFRQLQQLLVREPKFITRYPEAHKILFPRMAGSGLPLPSFGIRVLRNQPHPVVRIPKSFLGRCVLGHLFASQGAGVSLADQSFWAVEKGILRGLLLAILSREEYSERIVPSYCDPELFEGKEVRRKFAVRITDLRLAIDLDPGDLDHATVQD